MITSANTCFLAPKQWPMANVQAFSTTRLPPNFQATEPNINTANTFADFNLATHVNDQVEKVAKNRALLRHYLPSNCQIQWLTQVHGDQVAEVEQFEEQAIVADAAITRNKNIALAVMTADCLPILLADKAGTEIAVIHAGWRPLLANIIEKTVQKMQSQPNDLYAWLGPCISQQAFEVGAEVLAAFSQTLLPYQGAFIEKSKNNSHLAEKYLFDLALVAKQQLALLGVNNIEHLAECSYQNPEKYYSYRRDAITGRMASIIALK